MSVALIQSPDDFALLEAGWFRSPSTTVREVKSGFTGAPWRPLSESLYKDMPDGALDIRVERKQIKLRERRVVVSPPEQCIPHPCSHCGGSGKRPTPEGWDQRAHLDAPDRTCECHDSWDQCPCAEGGHRPDCDCCPGETGICGRRNCERCGGSGMVAEPLLIGVEQCRHPILAGRWMDDEWGPLCDSPDRCCRRQALLVRVTLTGGPIPFVGSGGLLFHDGPDVHIYDETPPWTTKCRRVVWLKDGARGTDLTDVLGGKVAPGDELYSCSAVLLDEPIVDKPCPDSDGRHGCKDGFCAAPCRVPLSLPPVGQWADIDTGETDA